MGRRFTGRMRRNACFFYLVLCVPLGAGNLRA